MAHVTYTLLHRRGGVTLHISEAWAWQVVVTLQRSCFGGNERQVDFHSLSDSPPGALLSHLVCEQILMSDCEQGGSGWVQYLASQEEDPRGSSLFSLPGIAAMALCSGAEQGRTVGHRGERGS